MRHGGRTPDGYAADPLTPEQLGPGPQGPGSIDVRLLMRSPAPPRRAQTAAEPLLTEPAQEANGDLANYALHAAILTPYRVVPGRGPSNAFDDILQRVVRARREVAELNPSGAFLQLAEWVRDLYDAAENALEGRVEQAAARLHVGEGLAQLPLSNERSRLAAARLLADRATADARTLRTIASDESGDLHAELWLDGWRPVRFQFRLDGNHKPILPLQGAPPLQRAQWLALSGIVEALDAELHRRDNLRRQLKRAQSRLKDVQWRIAHADAVTRRVVIWLRELPDPEVLLKEADKALYEVLLGMLEEVNEGGTNGE